MSSSSRRPRAARLLRALVVAVFAAALAAGCKAMANPEDSDLPWAQTNSWELMPNLPHSMIND